MLIVIFALSYGYTIVIKRGVSMPKRAVFLFVLSQFFLTVYAGFSDSPVFLVPMLDESGNVTGLFNENPDPEGEPWISGGGRELTAGEEMCIPELTLPERYRDRTKYPLPVSVDNSKTKYFPPLLSQKGASCCQASGVAYLFSYEICRIRDLDASKPANIFPYGFSYNFINGGSTSTYSSYFDGWYVAQELGMPDLESYGGALEGTASQTSWLNGYDAYYKGMFNRYIESLKMTCTQSDGITKMKQWIFDRADGSSPGGCICFLAWSGQTSDKIPSNSPEAGHSYVKKFGTTGGHCMTLAGYHDEIFFDLDGDGQIAAEEKGGFLMVNSYGTSYGTQGRAYIPYKVFLDGQMKSSSVHGITVKKECKPLLTYKIKITHNSRSSIEIIRGFSTDLAAAAPAKTYRYKQSFSDGGALPMQGKGLDETIEIGLDVSEFMPDISGNKAKFFLQINSSGGSGKVNTFSVLDYTGGAVKEYTCTQNNVTLASGMNTLWVVSGDAVNSSHTAFARPQNSRHFYASPLTGGKDILFNFSAPDADHAVFKVVTIHGKLLYTQTIDTRGANSFSWNVTDNAGKPAAHGKYIAQLEIGNQTGAKRVLYTQFYVMK